MYKKVATPTPSYVFENKSYVLRAGRMTPAQKHGWQYWAQWGLEGKMGLLDSTDIFKRKANLVLEIGYGMGDSLIQMACEKPDTDFIGIEVHKPGVGRLLQQIHRLGLVNLRTYCQDATAVLQSCIPDGLLDRLQVYFPDPWPKKKHHKRRLITKDFVRLAMSKLKIGGIIHLATDWESYAIHMQETLDSVSELQESKYPHDFPHTLRPETKFEVRGKKLGHSIWDFIYERQSA